MTEDKESTEEKTETKKEEKEVFKLVEVTTQTQPAIQDPQGNLMTDSEGIVKLLNDVQKLKENLL